MVTRTREPRPVVRSAKFTEAEAREVERIAASEGMNVSEFIRASVIMANATAGHPFFVKVAARAVGGAFAEFARKVASRAAAAAL